MSRKSFQRVTLSVELTLPAGMKPAEMPKLLKDAVQTLYGTRGISPEQTVIKITKRETIYP